MVLDLNNKATEVEVLEVKIGEGSYNIPLGSNMTMKQVNSIRQVEDINDFLKEYIPEDILEGLTIVQLTEIIKAWNKATRESVGMTMGELKALRGSSKNIARQ